MKKLLLLLFLIPNLGFAKSFLCISEHAAGIKQNYQKGTFEETIFKAGNKYIVKKVRSKWKAIPFGEKDDSIYTEITKCEEFKRGLKEDGEVNFLSCETFGGSFSIHFDNLRFVSFRKGDWNISDQLMLGNGVIEYGACSSL